MKKLISACLLTLMLLCLVPAVQADSMEILYNPGFEEELTGWSGNSGGKLELEQELVHDGRYAARYTQRKSNSDTPQQEITTYVDFYGPGQYRFTAWVRTTGEFTESMIMGVVQIVSSDKTSTDNEGKAWFSTNYALINDQEYTKITGVVDLQWAADLEYAQFYLYNKPDGLNPTADLIVDDCSIIKLGSVPLEDPPEREIIVKNPVDFMSIWWKPVLIFVLVGSALGLLPWKKLYKKIVPGKTAQEETGEGKE